jgi:L-aspartate oxidase
VTTKRSDFLVVGSGIAGLTFALHCAERGRVLIVTKSQLADSNTRYAQGGMAAAIGEDDSVQLHVEDTLRAGAGLCDLEAVKFLVSHAEERLDWLMSIGASFDPEQGEDDHPTRLSLGREGGHSRNRIVRRADQTGWEIERALTGAVRRHSNIEIMEYAFCESLLSRDGACIGALIHPREAATMEIHAAATCLATGSCCRVYRFTTNPPIATGDGIALAANAGASISNMEFIQFHPTTLYHRTRRGFLISEAVRGEGAILRNTRGRRFMFDYDSRGELAPRDIVARAIHAETQKEGVPYVHLDMTHIPPDEINKRFPFIAETLLSLGIDVTREPIPVVPAAHYQCGGVVTDLRGRTTIPGLYAAGEVACTGVHGANRLASNSLLEAVVFGWSAALDAISIPITKQTQGEARTADSSDRTAEGEGWKSQLSAQLENLKPSIPIVPRNEVEGIERRLRRIMWEHVGIVRRTRGLQHALEEIEEIIASLITGAKREDGERPPFSVRGAECANLLLCARLITQAALARKENVGLHYNSDLGPPWDIAQRTAPPVPIRP